MSGRNNLDDLAQFIFGVAFKPVDWVGQGELEIARTQTLIQVAGATATPHAG